MVRYLYTNCCEIALDNIDSVKALARSCRLPRLIDLIERKKYEIDEWRMFKLDFLFLFISLNILFILEASKTASSNIYRLVLEPDEDDDSIRLDFRMLAEQAVPLELRQWV